LAGGAAGGFFGPPHDAAKAIATASDPETPVAAIHRALGRRNIASNLMTDTPSNG
jgi:hypothetical protein